MLTHNDEDRFPSTRIRRIRDLPDPLRWRSGRDDLLFHIRTYSCIRSWNYQLTLIPATSKSIGMVPDISLFNALNTLRDAFYKTACEKGFHDQEGGTPVAEMLINIAGEACELWEAYRKKELDKPCDKASKMSEPLTCAEEEVADLLIRVMDLCAELKIDLGRAVFVKSEFNKTRSHRHGGKIA